MAERDCVASANERYVILVSGSLLLCESSGHWQPLTDSRLALLGLPVSVEHHLGIYLGRQYRILEVSRDYADGDCVDDGAGQAYVWRGLRSQLGRLDEPYFQLAGRALQVSQWHRDHRFCGRCGSPTHELPGERAKLCPRCDLRFYPRLSPCAITLVTRGNECLLARHARSRQPIYTCLAGFIELGERPEDTVHREVYEEVGVKLGALRYFASQPWPFPGQLMLGFHADYAEGDLTIDGEEIVDAGWYAYDQLPEIPPIATLSGQLIAHFVQQKSRINPQK